ncbi:MAG: hypothetical protein ACOYK8_10060 [Alphaproteobacteria bacterium]
MNVKYVLTRLQKVGLPLIPDATVAQFLEMATGKPVEEMIQKALRRRKIRRFVGMVSALLAACWFG